MRLYDDQKQRKPCSKYPSLACYAIKYQIFSHQLLAFRSGQCPTAASNAAFPFRTSAYFCLAHRVRLKTFQEHVQPAVHRYAYVGHDEIIVIEISSLTGKCVEASKQHNNGEEAE